MIVKCLTGCCYLHGEVNDNFNSVCFKNRFYCFISHYLLWNYVTEYSFFEFIQTSPMSLWWIPRMKVSGLSPSVVTNVFIYIKKIATKNGIMSRFHRMFNKLYSSFYIERRFKLLQLQTSTSLNGFT